MTNIERIDFDGIEKLLSDYKYGQYNILREDSDLKIKYDSKNGRVLLDSFYNRDLMLNQDTCAGLMHKAYNDIRLTYKDLFVARVNGNDTDYFFDKKYGKHSFLLISDDDFMNYESLIEDEKGIAFMIEHDPILVDPCFKKIMKFSESGYHIRRAFNMDYTIGSHSSELLENIDGRKSYTPLVLADNEMVLHLTADFNSEHYLGIGLQKKHMPIKKIKSYPIESPVLDLIFGEDETAYPFINHFRNFEKKPLEKQHTRI
ncbi:MAG TPA: hypothetical protein VEC16_05000 [Alphaproteobacteria bacterium]|nr:hypothetical protein [Alphaproteobacteria bacterium]